MKAERSSTSTFFSNEFSVPSRVYKFCWVTAAYDRPGGCIRCSHCFFVLKLRCKLQQKDIEYGVFHGVELKLFNLACEIW